MSVHWHGDERYNSKLIWQAAQLRSYYMEASTSKRKCSESRALARQTTGPRRPCRLRPSDIPSAKIVAFGRCGRRNRTISGTFPFFSRCRSSFASNDGPVLSYTRGDSSCDPRVPVGAARPFLLLGTTTRTQRRVDPTHDQQGVDDHTWLRHSCRYDWQSDVPAERLLL